MVTRGMIDRVSEKLKMREEENGGYIVVFWEDKTFGVVCTNDIVQMAEGNRGFKIGRAKFAHDAEYAVTYLFRGSDEEKLFSFAESLNTEYRHTLQRKPEASKRKPKRKIFDDFEIDVDTAGSETDGKVVKQKRVSKQDEKREKGKEKVPTKKEVLLAEKKMKETSREATLRQAEKFILEHVSNPVSPTPSVSSTSPASTRPASSRPASSTHSASTTQSASSTPLASSTRPASPTPPASPALSASQTSPVSPSLLRHTTACETLSVPPRQSSSIEGESSPSFSGISSTMHVPMAPLHKNSSTHTSLSSPHSSSMHASLGFPNTHSTFQFSTPSAFHSYFASANTCNSPFAYQNNRLHIPPDYQSHHSAYPDPQHAKPLDSQSSVMVSKSLSISNGDDICSNCLLKDQQIQSLTLANERANNDISSLHKRVSELEDEIAKQVPSNKQDNGDTEERVKEHYVPSRGMQVELANYQFVAVGEDLPASFERLAEDGELCVPRSWLCCILAKCKGKGPSFTFKKMMDGFFEPGDLVGRKAVEFCGSNRIMKAIKLYALNKLKMKESDFIKEVNSKCSSGRRTSRLLNKKK